MGKETDRKWEEGNEISVVEFAATEYGRKRETIATEHPARQDIGLNVPGDSGQFGPIDLSLILVCVANQWLTRLCWHGTQIALLRGRSPWRAGMRHQHPFSRGRILPDSLSYGVEPRCKAIARSGEPAWFGAEPAPTRAKQPQSPSTVKTSAARSSVTRPLYGGVDREFPLSLWIVGSSLWTLLGGMVVAARVVQWRVRKYCQPDVSATQSAQS